MELRGDFTYSERVVMKDIKLILNIQLFAEDGNGDAGENGEFGIRNSKFEMNKEGNSVVLDDSAKNEKEKDIIKKGTEECGVRNAECGMNEDGNSDGLDDEASDEEEKEFIEEDTDEENFIHEREERLRNRISGWLKESGEIKEVYPDFDLRNELRSSKLFAQLVLAGAPLKASYEIVHKDEIISGAMAYTADKVREQVVKNIETKGRRPLENGISSESAVMTAVDVNALTAKDIHKILKQVENGASIKF